jgi:catechol 2,3-dioxygenase-like lactoylglutathione lyase family enzyme
VSIQGEWIEDVVQLKDVRADVIYLECESGPRVELLKYVSPDGPRPAGLGQSNVKGLRHLAFRVADIDGYVARLRGAGVKFFSEVRLVPDTQVRYAGGARKQLVYFHDPEGNLLELCWYGK